MDKDDMFYEDAKEAIKDSEKPQEPKKDYKPLFIIVGLIALLIFVLSAIPIYSVKLTPPADLEAVHIFKLTEAEASQLANITGGQVTIPDAIQSTNVKDYRIITNRLVTSACSVHSDLCYAEAVYNYVRDSTQYVSDPKIQYVQSPAETLLSKGSDCEDRSLLLAAQLESIGIDADIGVTSDHAFVRAQLPNAPFWLRHDEYVWLDPTTNQDFGKISFPAKDVIQFYEVA